MNSFFCLSSAFGLPVVQAKSATKTMAESTDPPATSKVKVSSIPLYPEEESLQQPCRPPSKIEDYVKDARIQATNIKAECQPAIDKVLYTLNTGKAHLNETLYHLRDEKNIASQMGAVVLGGFLGLISARRRGFLRKTTSFLLGAGGAGAVCYPDQAKLFAQDAGKLAVKNAKIAYHFVVGVRPAIPNENGRAFERVMDVASDISRWGANLFETKNSEDSKPETSQEANLQIHSDQNVKNESEKPKSNSDILLEPLPPPSENVEVLQSELPSVDSVEKSTATLDDAAKEQEISVPAPTVTSFVAEETPVEENVDGSTHEGETESAQSKETEEKEETSSSGLVYEGDLGQSNLEDKELYTTRE